MNHIPNSDEERGTQRQQDSDIGLGHQRFSLRTDRQSARRAPIRQTLTLNPRP
jgi:hypothetical protein